LSLNITQLDTRLTNTASEDSHLSDSNNFNSGVPRSNNSTNSHLVLPGLKIAIFSGDINRIDPFDWTDKFFAYATAAGWNTAQMLSSAP
jgi:hypothetical protein